MELLTSFLYQVMFTVGIIVIFGSLVALGRRGFCALIGRSGYYVLLVTGAVGTPVHELSHALMCLVFKHKIREIKLYRPNADDGTLGYVTHTYNTKSFYQQIGNFFIGIAPILGGSGVLMLLMMLMVPDTFNAVTHELGAVGELFGAGLDLSLLGRILGIAWNVFFSVFDFSNAGNVWWWIFIVLALMISSHMELSGADMKGSVVGLLIILGVFFAMDAILFLIYAPALAYVTSAVIVGGLALTSFLFISSIFSLALLLIALVIKLISTVFGR